MDNQSIGGRLRLAMGEIGENELARMSGVPQSTIHRILTGDSREPRLSNLEKIARALDVSVLWLQTGIPEEPAAQSVKAAISFDLFPVEEWADDTPLMTMRWNCPCTSQLSFPLAMAA